MDPSGCPFRPNRAKYRLDRQNLSKILFWPNPVISRYILCRLGKSDRGVLDAAPRTFGRPAGWAWREDVLILASFQTSKPFRMWWDAARGSRRCFQRSKAPRRLSLETTLPLLEILLSTRVPSKDRLCSAYHRRVTRMLQSSSLTLQLKFFLAYTFNLVSS